MSGATTKTELAAGAVPSLCEACQARHRGVCGALSTDQLRRLNAVAHRRSTNSGEELVATEEPVRTFSNILSGVVKLYKMLPDGRQQIVGLQFAPDFLGRPFASDSAVSAEAVTPTELCVFPRALVEQMIEESPALERKLLTQALQELEEARELILTLGRKTALEKVVTFLLLIAGHLPGSAKVKQGAVTIDLPLARAEIADFLGLTIETVSRQLTKLKGMNVIRLEGTKQIRVPDIAKLASLSGD